MNKIQFPIYTCDIKQEVFTDAVKIEPDGFSSWGLYNMGSNTLVINGVIRVPPLANYENFEFPYCIWNGELTLSFEGAGTNSVTFIRKYYNEKK